jgi:hypothetical protein
VGELHDEREIQNWLRPLARRVEDESEGEDGDSKMRGSAVLLYFAYQ